MFGTLQKVVLFFFHSCLVLPPHEVVVVFSCQGVYLPCDDMQLGWCCRKGPLAAGSVIKKIKAEDDL